MSFFEFDLNLDRPTLKHACARPALQGAQQELLNLNPGGWSKEVRWEVRKALASLDIKIAVLGV